jgi:hypothetical protein
LEPYPKNRTLNPRPASDTTPPHLVWEVLGVGRSESHAHFRVYVGDGVQQLGEAERAVPPGLVHAAKAPRVVRRERILLDVARVRVRVRVACVCVCRRRDHLGADAADRACGGAGVAVQRRRRRRRRRDVRLQVSVRVDVLTRT